MSMTSKELRELDAFCASDVMGWTRVSSMEHLDHADRYLISKSGVCYCHGAGGSEQWVPTMRRDQAMQVLEKCLMGRPAGDTAFISDPDNHSFWLRAVKNGRHIDGQAATMPLAICLFAKGLFRE